MYDFVHGPSMIISANDRSRIEFVFARGPILIISANPGISVLNTFCVLPNNDVITFQK